MAFAKQMYPREGAGHGESLSIYGSTEKLNSNAVDAYHHVLMELLSQQTVPTKITKSPAVKHAGSAGSDPNCLNQVQTKEGLSITLAKGNIANATTDVIVNTVFGDLALNRGAVSNAILSLAGSKLQQLINANNARGDVGKVIVTDGCKLKSKQVFHAVAPNWDNGQGIAEKALSGIFKDCLGKAEDSGLTSISFPAIGTGNLGFPKYLVASLMLDEILAFSSKKQPKHLKKVVIILYSQDALTIQVFSDEFTKRFPNASGGPLPRSSSQSPGPFSKIVSRSGMHETTMGSVSVQVVTGDITKETTDVIINSSNEKFSLKSGVSKAILDAAGQAVETECQNLGAKPNTGMIITQSGNLKCKKILHLAGQSDPVKINKVVKDALQMCVKNAYTSVSFPAIGTGQGDVKARQVADAMLDAVVDVLSQYTSSPLKTVRIVIFQRPMLKEFYNSMHQREATEPKHKGGSWRNIGSKIKSLFNSGSADKPQQSIKVTVQGQHNTVTMPTGPATDNQGQTLQIKCIDKLKDEDTPDHWDAMPANTTSHAVTIKPGTEEHTEILNLFKATCQQTAIKIERIQNPILWKSLQIKKRDMEQRNSHQNNERRLFHGTSHDTVAYINEHGFNRSYAGKNDACFGNGTYFAVNAKYSAEDTYSRPKQNGEKCMYLCRVLTGDFTTGQRNMITPPAKGAVSVQKYDSVVDRMANPSMFVIFHDSQAYPEYLITFK